MATVVTTTAVPYMDMETLTSSPGIAEISTPTIATTTTTATMATAAAMAEAATVAESGLPGGSSYYHHDD